MTSRSRLRSLFDRPFVPWVIVTAIILVWLSPLTLLGQMPIGGDVTNFFLPLMVYYRQSLLDGRVPLWNELWGFGFPGLAESQMGVFYPPHIVLFAVFEVETAYSINIVLHHVLAGWFAYVCGRLFGLGRWGAALAGCVFAGNGFFIIQFPHQWSYTTGCWMPLAIGLAWLAGGRPAGMTRAQMPLPRAHRLLAGMGLAVVLATQMLAGHFQLAFYTQVIVAIIALIASWRALCSRVGRAVALAAAQLRRPAGETEAHPSWGRGVPTARRAPLSGGSPTVLLWIGLPVVAAFVLAAVQILPTYELIRIAMPGGRDFEYLSGFANTPFHLVSYLLPTLFHLNPLWRPVAWDPFHTSPEECFSYVGLVPLCLALGAAWRWRREPRVRLWVLLALVTLLLSLGPYVPGFRWLIQLPGFNGFRSTARWNLATALFLGLLAGRAFDGLRSVKRLRLWLRLFVPAFLLVGAACVGLAVLVVHAGAGPNAAPRAHALVRWIDRWWLAVCPWDDRSGFLRDHSLAGVDYGRITPGELTGALKWELVPPILWLFVVGAALQIPRWRGRVPHWLLFSLAVVDLGAATWLRPTEFIARGDLVEKSAVLAYLKQHAAGQRVRGLQNLPMLAGAGAVDSYRTVDIEFTSTYFDPDRPENDGLIYDRCDTVWEGRLLSSAPADRHGGQHQLIWDGLLARMLYGKESVRTVKPTFLIRRRTSPRIAHAWFWAAQLDASLFTRLASWISVPNARPSDRTYPWLVASPAIPVPRVRAEPEVQAFEFDASGPGMLVVSELAYPGWEARILTGDGEPRLLETLVREAGCILVRIPSAGKFRVQLSYRSRPYELGRATSIAAAMAWMLILLVAIRSVRRVSTSPCHDIHAQYTSPRPLRLARNRNQDP